MVTMTASIYWSLGRVKTAPPGVTYCLPSRLTLAMEAFLKSHPHVKQDAHLSIFLGHGLEQGMGFQYITEVQQASLSC